MIIYLYLTKKTLIPLPTYLRKKTNNRLNRFEPYLVDRDSLKIHRIMMNYSCGKNKHIKRYQSITEKKQTYQKISKHNGDTSTPNNILTHIIMMEDNETLFGRATTYFRAPPRRVDHTYRNYSQFSLERLPTTRRDPLTTSPEVASHPLQSG
jgi:hypothetical protein